jgi:hypothetical protein
VGEEGGCPVCSTGLLSGTVNDGLVFNCAVVDGPAMGLTPSEWSDGSGRYPCLILSAVSRASMASINGLRFDWRVVSFCNSEVVGGFERVWDSPDCQLSAFISHFCD